MKIAMSIKDYAEKSLKLQDMKHFFFNEMGLSILESYQDNEDFILIFTDASKKDTLPNGARRFPLTFIIEAMTDEETKKEIKQIKQILNEINLLVEDD